MQKGVWSIIFALSLAACGGNAPAEEAADTGSDINAAEAPLVPVMGPQRDILAFGNSLFAGYNVDKEDSYPAKLQNALRANGVNARVSNAGISGDTSAAGLQRFAFTLNAQDYEPDLVIIELGGNDLLRGLSPDQTRANIAAMIEEAQKRGIRVLLMGMRAPPNYGPEYQAEFDALYSDLAREYGTALIPFWLESIYQDPTLFQSDRIHPTEIGIETLVSATVDEVRNALPEEQS
ncbi:arylesterase [Altererythrobacter sp.]|uniref:arylesterase n=1 Tax=Altererythrobacter sp. TaxID=1872480 RepID=UPI001B2714DF|nr:arylesterase [Altererythrobacter sp.]MBO6608595.1 arylesterase [Altererythrobacter sp.]MBO6642848.1 arylesterase [Altererythrobacter sp.]MBO6709591.1 arylesterase [Altererythrobacter sp.]MBO6944100.1 arylesterase [Altererythrobacter sp.]